MDPAIEEVIQGGAQQIERWAEHFSELYDREKVSGVALEAIECMLYCSFSCSTHYRVRDRLSDRGAEVY